MSATDDELKLREFNTKLELNRVLTSFKLDPYDVLNILYTADDNDISKAYRNISLKIHPDRCHESLKIDAQNAFSKIAQAKDDINNDEKKVELNVHIKDAKDKVDLYVTEYKNKKIKELKKNGLPIPDDIQLDFDINRRWKNEVKETIIEHEWRKRQAIKQSKEMQAEATVESELRKKRAIDDLKFDSAWEESRDIRINSWKNFQSTTGGRKKPKLPKHVETERKEVHIEVSKF